MFVLNRFSLLARTSEDTTSNVSFWLSAIINGFLSLLKPVQQHNTYVFVIYNVYNTITSFGIVLFSVRNSFPLLSKL